MVADVTPCCLNLCELPFSQSESKADSIYKEKVGSWYIYHLFICLVNISLGLVVGLDDKWLHHFCFYRYYRIMGSYWKFNKWLQSSMKSSFVVKVRMQWRTLLNLGHKGWQSRGVGLLEETAPHNALFEPWRMRRVHWRKGQEKEQDIWYPGSGRELCRV